MSQGIALDRSGETQQVAKGRWKLLRQAILERRANIQSPYSIHSFPGFGLMLSRPCTEVNELDLQHLIRSLSSVSCSSNCWTPETLLRAVQIHLCALVVAFQSSQSSTSSIDAEFTLCISPPIPDHMGSFLAHSMREVLSGEMEIDQFEILSPQSISFRARPVAPFFVNTYAANKGGVPLVITCEKLQRPLRLDDLVSHHHNNGVGNTGHVCVWDAEKTLAWAVLRENSADVETVVEVGVGMAGVAGLALAASGVPQLQVYLTDGSKACVQNNDVNVQLMIAAQLLRATGPTVFCRQLNWSCDRTISDEATGLLPPADWTLASDCTHFEEHHAKLLWTLVRCTKVHGQIWICQPSRGESLSRFLDIVDNVNTHACQVLLSITERVYNAIEAKHKQFEATCREYRGAVHKPRVFVMKKLREAEEGDRQLIRLYGESMVNDGPHDA